MRQPFMLYAVAVALERPQHRPTDSQLVQMKLTRAQFDSIIDRNQRGQVSALESVRGGAIRVTIDRPNVVTHHIFDELKLLRDRGNPTLLHEDAYYLQLVRSYTRAFFDKYVKGERGTLLDRPAAPAPGVTIERYGAAAHAGSH
jgi:hypothetical protein